MEETPYFSANWPEFGGKRNAQFARFLHAFQEHTIIVK